MIKKIFNNFINNGIYLTNKPISDGNINKTYLIEGLIKGKTEKFILQKINKFVFKNPEQVMENIVKVCNHINGKNQNDVTKTLNFIYCENKPYYIDKDGEYWRLYQFIDNSVSFNQTDNLYVIEQAGYGFGTFQAMLNDFNPLDLHETIQYFHNTKKRYNDLLVAIDNDDFNRCKNAQDEIDYILSKSEISNYYQNLIDKGLIPIRVTHNDTKCNNVLFDNNTNRAIAVIDLDTVMPGIIAYDFGDGVRSISATEPEDSENLNNVRLNLDKYQSFAKGFLTATKNNLTKIEKETIHLAPYIMTLELSIRFLTDYLCGDKYFKIDFVNHNLLRTKNQVKLCQNIETNLDIIKNITEKFIY